MKKLLFVMFAMVLLASGVQAQKKTTNKPNKPNVGVDGKNANAMPVINLQDIILPPAHVGMDVPLMEALRARQTIRDIMDEELPMEIISSLLWSAYGFNRYDEQKRVAPSAVNVQEFDIYLFTNQGIYLYDALKQLLRPVVEGDHRALISAQKHFAVAPVSVVIVANYDRMTKFKETADRDFYAAVDAGYVSQNIYLFCASAHLATVACGGINRDDLAKILNLKNGKALLAHPVGLPVRR
ncbi:MAG: SagB/ThcOx family dehydrogenase [Bacteroidales bacterium]|nr:SagB/ThcOx family dehydrogenase [Bacteroidales bacterium]